MDVLQEKFQVEYPPTDDDDGTTWVTDMEARAKKNLPGREGHPGGDSDSRFMNTAVQFNSLPPGMDIEDQEVTDQRKFNHSVSGGFAMGPNAGDERSNVNRRSVNYHIGYNKLAMSLTEDQWTREHNDAFYDDVGGFVERNNMLDRE